MEITMREYLKQKYRVRFKNEVALKHFLEKCEKEKIMWIDGDKATNFKIDTPANELTIQYDEEYDGGCLGFSTKDYWGLDFENIEIYEEEKKLFTTGEAIDEILKDRTKEFTDKYGRILKYENQKITILNKFEGKDIGLLLPDKEYVWQEYIPSPKYTFNELIESVEVGNVEIIVRTEENQYRGYLDNVVSRISADLFCSEFIEVLKSKVWEVAR